MKDTIALIRELQNIDSEVIKIRRRQKAGPVELAMFEKKLTEANLLVANQQAQIQAAKKDADASSLLVKSCEDELDKLKCKLRTIKNTKEFEILRDAIQDVEERKSINETAALESMEKTEVAEAALTGLKEQAAAAKAEVDRVTAEISEEQNHLIEQIDNIRLDRNNQKQKLDPEVLIKYEGAIRTGKGVAVVELIKGTCQGCFRKQLPNIEAKVMGGKSLANCEGCGRFLYSSINRED